jgi:hypothetical protein|tara:strand:+ start:583 stop:1062 length:480 start_codon:yes stop_codon:yes gene_type:complete
MATRNMIMVVDRRHAEQSDLGFADSPEAFADHSRVNMYMHHDGYPEWQAVQIANWLQLNSTMDGARLAAKLVHDMYYDSCYLYNNWINIDHQYTYIIWTGKKDMWVSCWDNYSNRNVFVLPPEKINERYETDMEYTDFAKETRWQQQQERNAMWVKKVD